MPRIRMPKKITTRWLRRHDACDDAVAEFRRVFGAAGAPLAREAASRAAAAGLDIEWLAVRLLSDEAIIRFGADVEAAALRRRRTLVADRARARHARDCAVDRALASLAEPGARPPRAVTPCWLARLGRYHRRRDAADTRLARADAASYDRRLAEFGRAVADALADALDLP